ncbi:guanine nucleotide-binding protein-like 3 [Hyperolius riggenbachi]|uniref:guanine nucleotide-binding protein-like 3 n=1 Tax=Hyperolius riggenbachi TaxID=752182 RepID=UPI0035A34070
MKRPKLRKSSKRMSCSKRFKIQKRVREHNRKVKKEAKKGKQSGNYRKPKKDLSVPNSAPFKEDILREAELRKQQREELKNAQKLARQKEQEKKRKEKERSKSKAKKEAQKSAKKNRLSAKNPAQSFCIEVNKMIAASDVILEVLDSRDPLGSRCLQAEQAVLQSPNKRLVLVLNKTDLVPKDNIEKWLQILSNELPTVAFKCSTEVREKNLPSNERKMKSSAIDVSKGTVCHGRDSLLRVLRELRPSPEGGIKVGLMGFSNVGKSSLINSMKESRACNVGSLRGTTRFMQEVNIDESIRMIDSPSIVVSPDNPPVTLVMRSALQKETEDVLKSVEVILEHCDKQQIMLRYNIADFRSPSEFLDFLARRRGMLKKGAVADAEAAARLFLNDWMGARLSYHTPPAVSSSFHITNEQRAEMQKGVDVNALDEANESVIKGLNSPSPSSSILFSFSQMTSGVMDEAELQEEEPKPEEQEEEEHGDDGGEEEEDDDEGEGEEDIEEEKPQKTGESSADKQSDVGKKTAGKSVQFDKAEDADDAYDFNTDFF